MANERTIPISAPADLPTFTIYLDGKEMNGIYQVFNINTLKQVNRIPVANILLKDGDVAKEDFEISNLDDFLPGAEIEIHAGYHKIEEIIFKGIIIKHGLKIKKGKPSYLEIEAKDEAVKLTVGRKNKFFYDSKDSDIIQEIIGEYPRSSSNIKGTTVNHKELVQFYTTDWDYIVTRCEANGMLVFVDNGEIAAKKPELGNPALTLVYGSTILEFESVIDARNQLESIVARSWDYAKQEMIESDAQDPGYALAGDLDTATLSGVIGLGKYDLIHSGNLHDEEISSWADAAMIKTKLSKIRGRVSFQGYPSIKPGNTIELKGVGNRFNGNLFVSGVSHQINKSNFVTNVEFGISPEWFSEKQKDIQAPMAGGIIPPIQGLQIGKVTQIHEDPDGEHRVKIRIPVISTEEEGIWARYASPDAGDGRGIYFRPEVDDEVVIGFINNDPRYAVVLGNLHSSALPTPIDEAEENNEKGIVTRGGMKLVFDDNKKNIMINTPNGNEILLSEDEKIIRLTDENSNKIELSSSGILMESNKDITIKAQGDVTVESTNITLKASAQIKAEGSSGAELSSSGSAVIKGAVVQIN